jgi:hypothetical protein
MSHSSILSTLSTKLIAIEKLNLVQGGAVRHVLYSGHIRIPTVHNDYHSSKTNAGYSRNKYGGIYPKWSHSLNPFSYTSKNSFNLDIYAEIMMLPNLRSIYRFVMTKVNTKYVNYKIGGPEELFLD